MDFATTNFRYVRVIEGTPARNVSRCVGIGIGGKPARLARELIACGPVLLTDTAAGRTSPAGVARVNEFDRHSDKPALVGNLRLEIREGPRVQDAALLSVSPDPRTNTFQIFQGNPSIRAFSNTANLFGDDVIHVPHKSLFPSTEPVQDALGLARAFLLKSLSLPPSPSANFGCLASVTECLAVGTLREVHQSKVDAKPANSFLFAFLWHVHGHVEIPLAVTQNQIALAFRKFQQLTLALATDKLNMFQPSSHSPDAHGRGRKLEIKNASVVGNAAVLAKSALRLLVQLVGVSNLGVKADNNLRGQIELTANLFVVQTVHWELAKLLLFPAQFRQTTCRLIRQLQSFAQRLRLFWRRQKFHLNSQLHSLNIFKGLNMSNELRRNNHSVSRLMVHLVFVVKYRRAVISDVVWASLRYGFGLAAARLDLVLVEVNHDKDHAHLVVEYPPKISVSEAANALKGNSSFVVRRDCAKELRGQLWGPAFWTPSYFAASCGGAPLELLKLYVQSQQTKAAINGGVSTHKI